MNEYDELLARLDYPHQDKDCSEAAAAIRSLQAQLRTTYSGKAFVRLAEEFKAERKAREEAEQTRDRSIRRMVEMAEPGFIGAFSARDMAIDRAEAAERQLAELKAAAKAYLERMATGGWPKLDEEAELRKLVEGK